MSLMGLDIIFLIGLFYILGHSAGWVIDSLLRLGIKLRLSSFIIGFVVLGMATSIPEFVLGINSVINKIPALSVGNILGASIVLLSLTAGLSVILNKKICVLCSLEKKELFFLNGVVILPFLLLIDGILSRTDALFLIAFFVIFVFFVFLKNHRPKYNITLRTPKDRKEVKEVLGFLILGLIVLLLSSKYIVDISQNILQLLSISPLIIGISIFAIGTNLPEFILVYKSMKGGDRKNLVFGDILGSAAANSLVLGLIAFLNPIVIKDIKNLFIGGIFLALTLLLFNIFAISGRYITRREGFGLIAIYIIFILTVIGLNITY